MESRQFLPGTIKSDSSSDNDGRFVLNEESSDRMGDIIEVAGWELKNFLKNPIALFQHQSSSPVGSWSDVKVEGKRLLGTLKLGSTNLAQMAKQLIKDGVLRAVSVGFHPKDWEEMYDEITDEKGRKRSLFVGYRIKSAELLEVSLVSVPAHPNALLLSKSMGLTSDDRRILFSQKNVTPGAIVRARQALDAARVTLESL